MTTPQEAITAESILEKRLSEIRIGETKSEFELRNVSLTSDLGKEIISQVAHLYAQQYSIQQNKSEVRGREKEFGKWVLDNVGEVPEDDEWYQDGYRYRVYLTRAQSYQVKTFEEVHKKFLSSNPIAVEGEGKLDAQELWDEYSERIDENIDSLNFFAGRDVMTKEKFMKLIYKIEGK